MSVTTLRAWEARHGFPVPQRLPSGHRRYRASDVALIEQVLRDRAAGLSLEAALTNARGAETATLPRSIFTGLRRQRPDLVPHTISQRAMLAISRAIEDECCAVATRSVLIGSFQNERFYRRSEARWHELARTAELTVVFASFDDHDTDGDIRKVALPRAEPLLREWAVVCHAPDAHAVLAGWERSGSGRTQQERQFEAIWSAEPAVAALAARVALDLGRTLAPGILPSIDESQAADEDPLHTVRRAIGLTNRVVAYMEGIDHPA